MTPRPRWRLALAVALLAAMPAAASEPLERLTVASYNVQLAMPELPLLGLLLREPPGHKPNVAARAEAIGGALACFDVVALQETINDRRRAELAVAPQRRGRGCGRPARRAARSRPVFGGSNQAFPDRPAIQPAQKAPGGGQVRTKS